MRLTWRRRWNPEWKPEKSYCKYLLSIPLTDPFSLPKNFFNKLSQNPLTYWYQYGIIEPSKGYTQTTIGDIT